MRIVGGKYRHRNITFPDDRLNIRPTKDRIREAIFSALNDINGLVSLDLYAGSGAMGLEAISRGSKKCYFVDVNPIALRSIKENLTTLKVEKEQYEVIEQRDFDVLNSFIINNICVDLVFLDPPYAIGEYGKLLDILLNNAILSKNGIIVIESNHVVDIDSSLFSKVKQYKYGDIIVYICWR